MIGSVCIFVIMAVKNYLCIVEFAVRVIDRKIKIIPPIGPTGGMNKILNLETSDNCIEFICA